MIDFDVERPRLHWWKVPISINVRNVHLDAQFTRFTRACMTPFKQFWQVNKKGMLYL